MESATSQGKIRVQKGRPAVLEHAGPPPASGDPHVLRGSTREKASGPGT